MAGLTCIQDLVLGLRPPRSVEVTKCRCECPSQRHSDLWPPTMSLQARTPHHIPQLSSPDLQAGHGLSWLSSTFPQGKLASSIPSRGRGPVLGRGGESLLKPSSCPFSPSGVLAQLPVPWHPPPPGSQTSPPSLIPLTTVAVLHPVRILRGWATPDPALQLGHVYSPHTGDP